MYCPQCGAEYRPGISECVDCGETLVLSPPEEEQGRPDAKIVPIFKTTDSALLPVVRSLLDSAGVEYFIQGEEALGLLPVGSLGSSVGRASLGAIVHVAEEDADSVKQMLAEVVEADELEDEELAAPLDKHSYDEDEYDDEEDDLEDEGYGGYSDDGDEDDDEGPDLDGDGDADR